MKPYEQAQLSMIIRRIIDSLQRVDDTMVWTEIHRDTLIELIETIDRLFKGED